MSYSTLEETYSTLTEEQQLIVYNLAQSLYNMNINLQEQAKSLQKRRFGKFAGIAKATFHDDWEMSEEDLCAI